MPASPREIVLCRYRYDPLDRLIDYAPDDEPDARRFYCKSRLATEIQGVAQRSLFQHDDQVLAQIRREDVGIETALLATDQQRSVLNVLEAKQVHSLAYSPYGHRPAENGLLNLLGFNGEQPDPVTRHYLLGNGYRAFNPVLMRFNSPDSLSPFGEGGLNAYGYGAGDPVNWTDPTGHIRVAPLKTVKKSLKPQVAASTSVGTQSGRVAKANPTANATSVKTYQQKNIKMVNIARMREHALGPHDYFTVNPRLTDANQSLQLYEALRIAQGFDKHPSISKPVFMFRADGTQKLNTLAFDTRVDVALNLNNRKKLRELNAFYRQQGLTPLSPTNGSQVTLARLARARYISEHSPVKLIRE